MKPSDDLLLLLPLNVGPASAYSFIPESASILMAFMWLSESHRHVVMTIFSFSISIYIKVKIRLF